MKKFYLLLLLFCVFNFSASGQLKEKTIDSLFSAKNNVYQEVVYAHLNKSTYVKGEMLAFTAYVFEKQTKLLSNAATNLYCKLLDGNNTVIKEKLILVKNGIANDDFTIDDKFKEGNYTFVVFTNWMLNFSSRNIYSQPFKVIDASSSKNISKTKRSNTIDIQLTPESGHFLADVENTIGVVVKDTLGYGVANLKGTIYTANNSLMSSFELNALGIGKFSFVPEASKKYKLIIEYNDKKHEKIFGKEIKKKGVLLRVTQTNTSCIVSVITNAETLPSLQNKPLALTFNDGTELKSFNIQFKESTIEAKKIGLSYLATGVNVFTLFDENQNPIAERLLFNYNNLTILKSRISSVKKIDSIVDVQLSFNDFKKDSINNVSISVLPVASKSYAKNNNIIAQTLLKPYINGHLQNADYYFKRVTRKTKYDLDNLLITQGWSSYSWDEIFNQSQKKLKYTFENGITVTGSNPKKRNKEKSILVRLNNEDPILKNLNDSIKSFTISGFYPNDKDQLSIANIEKKGKLDDIKLDVSYVPSKIPEINEKFLNLPLKENYYEFELYNNVNNFSKSNSTETLDEIELNINLEELKKEKIISKSRGVVYFTRKMDRLLRLEDYLNRTGRLVATQTDGELVVSNKRLGGLKNQLGLANNTFGLFLDGKLVFGTELVNFFMEQVEYIEITPGWSFIDGRSFPGGSIQITTNPEKFQILEKKTVSKYDFPLKFSSPKKFYTPKYQDYNSTFFKSYGVIDWLPINKIDENGNLNLQISTEQQNDMILFLEGITNNGAFIFEEITIKKQ